MNFDLSWFTTPSGLFITGGVILLIIALIILLITGRNSKKEKKAKEQVVNNESPVSQPSIGQTQVQTVDAGYTQNGMSNPQGVDVNVGVNPPLASSMTNVVSNVPEVAPVTGVSMENTVGVPATPMVSPMSTPTNISSGSIVEPVPMNQFNQPAINQSMSMAPEVVSPTPVVNYDNGQQDAMMNGFAMPEEPIPVAQPAVSVSAQPNAPEVLDVSVPVSSSPIPAIPTVSEPSFSSESLAVPTDAVSVANSSLPMSNEPVPMPTDVAPSVNSNPTFVEPITSIDHSIPQVVVPTVSEVAPQPVEPVSTEPVIYGGASPAVTGFNVSQETNHQIYGGADPLQNTQTIPTTVPTVGVPTPVVTEPVMISQQPVAVVPNIVPNSNGTTNSEISPVVPLQ